MSSPISKVRSDLPSPKRQKVEEAICYEEYDNELYDSDEYDELLDSFSEEFDKSQGFEMEFSKLKYTFGWKQLDLDGSAVLDQSQTNRDLMVILAKEALSQREVDQEKCLELHKILRANYHLSAGITYYISFLVNDLSDGNQTEPLSYRATVRQHVTGDIYVRTCNPKPASSS